MKTITSTQFLSFLESFGLSPTDQSGGMVPGGIQSVAIDLTADFISLIIDNGIPITCLPGDLFQKTVVATERSLCVRLFH